jgi:hypothetical protein
MLCKFLIRNTLAKVPFWVKIVRSFRFPVKTAFDELWFEEHTLNLPRCFERGTGC